MSARHHLRPAKTSLKMFIFAFLFSLGSQGAEIDSFTPRFKAFPDGLPAINTEVNRRIQNALKNANKISSCNHFILETVLGLELLRPFYGRIEDFINTSQRVPKYHVLFEDSVYKNLPQANLVLMTVGQTLFGFGHVVHEKELIIGSDKFGHFFDEGYWFYTDLMKDAKNIEEVLTKSEGSEEGLNGLALGGVKSYADLVANYQGMHFWSQMLKPKFKNGKPYLKCQKNKWQQIRLFDFRHYVDAGWDEGYNCSEYQSVEYEQAVLSSIAFLPLENITPSHCPISRDVCRNLILKYGKFAPKLIGPKCRGLKN